MAKIKVWVVTTCIPSTAAKTPCIPDAFSSAAAAESFMEEIMQREWEANGPCLPDSDERLPYPRNWREAQDQIADYQASLMGDGDEGWGEWQITSHEIEIGGIDYQALARRLSDGLLNVRPLGGSEMFIKVGDEFYADPERCAAYLIEDRAAARERHKELIQARAEFAALDAVTPPGRLSIGLPAVDRMPLNDVAAAALEIVRECDSYGERAQHPTTIRTRQLLERLANSVATFKSAMNIAAGELAEAADKFWVIHCNHPGERAGRAQGEDKAFCATMSERMLTAWKAAQEVANV